MLDIQETTRRDNNYLEINKIIDSLSNLDLFPRLTWVYVWDIVKYKLDYYAVETDEYYVVNPKFTEKDVFDMLWVDADHLNLSLEYGVEYLHDKVQDWMTDKEILLEDINEEDEVE